MGATPQSIIYLPLDNPCCSYRERAFVEYVFKASRDLLCLDLAVHDGSICRVTPNTRIALTRGIVSQAVYISSQRESVYQSRC